MATERIVRVNSKGTIYHAPYKSKQDMQSQIEAMQVLLATMAEHTDESVVGSLIETMDWRLADLYNSVNTLTFRGYHDER